MRRPAGIDRSVREQQRSALFIALGVERRRRGSADRKGCADFNRAVQQLGAGCDIERVQPLMIVRAAVDRHGDDIHRSVSAGGAVDHRRRSNADFRRDLIAAAIVARHLARAEQRHLPEDRARIRIEGVNRVVLGGDENRVEGASSGTQRRQIQRLCVDSTINRQNAQQAECRCRDIRRASASIPRDSGRCGSGRSYRW